LSMSLKVVIPTPLRKHTGGLEVIEVDAGTVKEVIDRLESKFPGIRNSVCDDSGGLRRFINVYVDGEDVRFLQNLSTPAKDGSEIAIVPAISGGV
jgi:sulfur-carrier protein